MERPCNLVLSTFEDNANIPKVMEIKKNLETGDDDLKIESLKQAISLMLAGEKLPQLLMTIIRFVITTRNHTIKRLLLLYWEVVDMVGPDGTLLPEMILVCNSLRSDLIHPNEYVRGSTLRLICKLKVAELLEPLVPSITKNLEHRHSYVRRNAVLAVQSVYLKMPQLCPDAPELVYEFLKTEEDVSCKRNGMLMLFATSQERAIRYLNERLADVPSWGEILQCAAIDIIRRHNREGISDSQKSRYVRAVLELLKVKQATVQYEAACGILELSASPISAKAAAEAFIDILCTQSDNNVKFVVLDKLTWIKKKQGKVLQELLMDILRALACPSLEIRRKTLDLGMDLVNPRNIDSVIMLLQKEITKTQTEDLDHGAEYRKILIKTIHNCALRFPNVAGKVVHALIEHLGDNDAASALNVISFVSEVVVTYPELREEIIRKLLDSLGDIQSTAVLRVALWVAGEYSESVQDLDVAFTLLKKQLGRMPLLATENDATDADDSAAAAEKAAEPKAPAVKSNRVLADGTYATQSAYVESDGEEANKGTSVRKSGFFLRDEVLKGDFAMGSIAARSLVKIALKLKEAEVDESIKNGVTAEVLYICACMLQLIDHQSEAAAGSSAREDIVQFIKLLLDPSPLLVDAFLRESRTAHKQHLDEYNRYMNVQPEKKQVDVEADDKLSVRLLHASKFGNVSFEDDTELDLMKATGASERDTEQGALSRVRQLTGFSDPLYAECYINSHKYDIVLEVLVINRTKETLQNVGLELSTMGDLQITKRANLQTHTLAPLGKVWIRTDVKVSSTEAGMVYGNLVYDIAGSSVSDKNCVVLNSIRVDILDYIEPATCSDSQYRSMWYAFEWENKVPVNAKASSVFEFLDSIIKGTHMKCLTPASAMEGNCRFLAANLYSRSVFGEDALANMSIEQLETGEISGYIRIRSKTQGIALSLGDKVAQCSQA